MIAALLCRLLGHRSASHATGGATFEKKCTRCGKNLAPTGESR